MKRTLALLLVGALAFAVLAAALYVAGTALKFALAAAVVLAIVGFVAYHAVLSALRPPRRGPPAASS